MNEWEAVRQFCKFKLLKQVWFKRDGEFFINHDNTPHRKIYTISNERPNSVKYMTMSANIRRRFALSQVMYKHTTDECYIRPAINPVAAAQRIRCNKNIMIFRNGEDFGHEKAREHIYRTVRRGFEIDVYMAGFIPTEVFDLVDVSDSRIGEYRDMSASQVRYVRNSDGEYTQVVLRPSVIDY